MNDYDFDFGSLADLGSFEDLAAVDLGNLDFGDIDLGGMDLSGLKGMDLSGFDLGDANIDDILANLGGGGFGGVDDFGSNFDLGSFEDLDAAAFAGPDYGSNVDLGSFEDLNAAAFAGPDYGSKGDLGADEDMAPKPFDMKSAGWQKTKDGRYVLIQEDGSAQGIDEDGNIFALSESQVQDRIKSGDLNTYESGYNTLTGGDKYAPGGGRPVTLNNGQTGTLLPGGKVINTETGKEIGTIKDVKDEPKTPVKPDGPKPPHGGGGGGGSKDNSLGSLLPLLLMMLMMNKEKGGGGSSAVIPALAATQRQTPYTQQQRAPGARPGQGGITYFDQTQYTPKMASGGIARLLKGPGDGVSDSIPAVITNGMSRGGQPAKVARGEYIIDARTVAALGNGSTDAGAERLDRMRKNILRDDRRAGVGKDSKAYRHLMA